MMTDSVSDESEVFVQCFDDLDGRYSVVVEEDNGTLYAYLLRGKEIVGDVWLENRGEAPASREWETESAQPPFRNAAEYVRGDIALPALARDGSNLSCRWETEDADVRWVDISFDGIWVARLADGSTPGWSLLASRTGPLARPLSELTLGT